MRNRKQILCLFVAATCLAASLITTARAQEVESTLRQQVEQYLKASESVYNFTGSAAIAKGGKIIYAGGFGMADFEAKRKNAPTTRFLIGSVTKQFTAAAILQMQEKGLLSVDDTLKKYFSDFPENIANTVTIRHLLTHTSGIANYTASTAFATWLKTNPSLDDQIAMIATLPPDFAPGERYQYSNSGYKLLEGIIVKISGMPWDQYMAKNILAPAGLSATGFDLMQVEEDLRAVGYTTPDSIRQRAEMWPPGVAGGAGALYSTTLDLIKWDEALRTKKLLSDASLAAMYTPNLDRYAFGWIIDSVGAYERIWHDGQIAGFAAALVRIPSEELCIAVLSNDDTGPARSLAIALSALAVGQPYDVPVRKTPVAGNPDRYPEYVGAYDLGGGQYRFITTENGKLFSQRAGSPQFEILPEGGDKFFYPMDNATTVLFIRNEAGEVMAQEFHQGGVDSRHRKLPPDEAEKVMPKFEVAQVDPAIYDQYVGEYQLAPIFSIVITREGNQIFGQATGQSKFEMFPSSETKFFLKVVEAQIEFVRGADGKVEQLILYQSGQVMPGKKIK